MKLLLESSKISQFQLTRLSFLFSSKIWIFTIELNISLMFKSFSKARWPQMLIHKNFKNAWFTKQTDWKLYEDFIENEDPIETEDQMEDWKFHWKWRLDWRLKISLVRNLSSKKVNLLKMKFESKTKSKLKWEIKLEMRIC